MNDLKLYDHYISVDWAQSNMAISRMTKGSERLRTIDVPASLSDLKLYLRQLRGRKILTFEETSTSQWLYTELKSEVDEIVVCDPYRNSLLGEGAKTDRLDAEKLVQLLKAGLLKPVFHSGSEFIRLRKLVSGYQDMIKAGVRLKNQRAAMFRSQGLGKRERSLEEKGGQFVLEGLEESIQFNETQRERYEGELGRYRKQQAVIRHLDSLPGIGVIGAVKIAAIVVDPKRFKEKGQWLSYCGLVRHEKRSGGRSYGSRAPRYCRTLKSVFKTAAMSVIGEECRNEFREYYEYLMKEKSYAEHNARHAVARRIAVVAWGIFKSGKPFQSRRVELTRN